MSSSYFPVLLWSLVILLSFYGYGEALRRALGRKEFDDLGWGLTCAWGMAFLMVVGGGLMFLAAAKAPVLALLVVAGALLGLFFAALQCFGKSKQTDSMGLPAAGLFVVYVLAGLAFASSIAWMNHIDPNDDLVCYLMLPEKILATGTLIEPFSFQRAGTFGGQALLQALVMIVGGETNGHVPDRGIAMLLLFGILLHVLRGSRGLAAIAALAVLFAFWFVPVPRISTNGAMTGGCLVVAMLATINRIRTSDFHWRAWLPVALVAAGACSVRPTFAVVLAGIFAGLALLALRSRSGGGSGWNGVKPLVLTGVFCVVLLVPFMVVLYRSNGTPMIPPFAGFVSKGYQTYDHPAAFQNLAAVVTFLFTPQTLVMALILVVAAWLPGAPERRWVIGGTVLACAVIVFRFGALAYLDLYRYIYPIAIPVGLWYVACALARLPKGEEDTPKVTVPAFSVLGAVALLLVVNIQQAGAELGAQFASLDHQIGENRTFLDPRLKDAYRTVQNAVPPGETILTMVDASYLLDYERNPMFSINAVGSSSPPPGIPFGKGPQALADYLKGLGIRYVMAVDFDNAVLLYTRKLWTETTRPEWFYREIWRPRFLDVMDSIDSWDRDGKVIARAGNVRMIDLGKN